VDGADLGAGAHRLADVADADGGFQGQDGLLFREIDSQVEKPGELVLGDAGLAASAVPERAP